jgi:hypothetical protein
MIESGKSGACPAARGLLLDYVLANDYLLAMHFNESVALADSRRPLN